MERPVPMLLPMGPGAKLFCIQVLMIAMKS